MSILKLLKLLLNLGFHERDQIKFNDLFKVKIIEGDKLIGLRVLFGKEVMMGSVTSEKYVYYQFNKKLNIPIYIRFIADYFDPDISGFLRTMKFDELTGKESEVVLSTLNVTPNARLLTISEASIMVARQIAASKESDKYGPESLIQKAGYSVYRYSSVAMLVFSLASNEWKMGCFSDFGHVANESSYRMIVNRFLSWSLASHGIVGFWGTPVEEGAVIQRAFETKGEALFMDIKRNRVLTLEGEKRLRHTFDFIKLDGHIKDKALQMKFEDLLSFLSINCTYFGPQGLPSFVRQLIQACSRNYNGKVFPKDNFKPRQTARLE